MVKTKFKARAKLFLEIFTMDLVKIGNFISGLRKEKGFTQEQLGKEIGATNKTVSRWETGTYLPPVDALMKMSEVFSVSINELVSGEKLDPKDYRQAAEDNLIKTISASSFTLKEKTDFFRKKWLKEHLSLMILMGLIIIIICITGFILRESLIIGSAMILLIIFHGIRNNMMMAYIERKVYDNSDRHEE